jgi:hypothetical protein
MPEAPTLAVDLIARRDRMKAARSSWDAFWQEVAPYVMPRKNQINRSTDQPDISDSEMLFDTTAIQANITQASGMMSYMVPKGATWFSFDPPAHLADNDQAKQWFQWCSDIARKELANSNFYEQIHESLLDRGAFGVTVIFCEEGKKNALNFTSFDCGTYSIDQNDEGFVDTLFRDFSLTARQAEQMFGDSISDKIKEALKEDKTKDERFEFIHAVYPRAEYDPKRADGENKPFASVYLEVKSKFINRESGYDEQAFFASRYLRWGETPYGWSPAWMALPDARQLNFLEKQMDALAEKAAFPPMLVPADHEGSIDTRALGVTYYRANGDNSVPREWQNTGRYDVGKDRAEVKRKSINRAYHVDLFQMFANYDGPQMTAREVSERQSEKLTQFSPTADRMTTELFNPLLNRVFAILSRLGKFPDPPMEIVIFDEQGAIVPDPEITYSSRIALAIKSLENNAWYRQMEASREIWQVKPELLDNYNLDEIERDLSRNNGLPARWIRDTDGVEEIRKMRAEAQAKQAEMEQAMMMAKAAGDVGKIPGAMEAMQSAA